jgi:hypothetical protein
MEISSSSNRVFKLISGPFPADCRALFVLVPQHGLTSLCCEQPVALAVLPQRVSVYSVLTSFWHDYCTKEEWNYF